MRLMTRSGLSRKSVLVAGLVALIYTTLVVIVSACPFGHVDAPGGHAHHRSHESSPHNALCAWACQATSDAVVAMETPMASSGPVVRQVVLLPSRLILSSFSPWLHSRAPPSIPFVYIG